MTDEWCMFVCVVVVRTEQSSRCYGVRLVQYVPSNLTSGPSFGIGGMVMDTLGSGRMIWGNCFAGEKGPGNRERAGKR